MKYAGTFKRFVRSLRHTQYKHQPTQNNIVRICLNKHTLGSSTNKNYSDLSITPIKSLYKKMLHCLYFIVLLKAIMVNHLFIKERT